MNKLEDTLLANGAVDRATVWAIPDLFALIIDLLDNL